MTTKFNCFLNILLREHAPCAERNIKFAEPAIVPLGEHVRLQRDVKTGRSMQDIFQSHFASACQGKDRRGGHDGPGGATSNTMNGNAGVFQEDDYWHEFLALRAHSATARSLRLNGGQFDSAAAVAAAARGAHDNTESNPPLLSARCTFEDNVLAFETLCGHRKAPNEQVAVAGGTFIQQLPPVPMNVLCNFVNAVVPSAADLFVFKVRRRHLLSNLLAAACARLRWQSSRRAHVTHCQKHIPTHSQTNTPFPAGQFHARPRHHFVLELRAVHEQPPPSDDERGLRNRCGMPGDVRSTNV